MVDANGGLVLLLTEILTVLVVLMVLATAGVRGWRRRRERSRLEAEAVARPLILAALDAEVSAGEEGEEPPAVSHLVGRYLDSMASAMAGKLRGGDRAVLVDLLRRRGTVDAARRNCRSILTSRRLRAVELLGSLGLADAVPELVARLDDSDDEVRRAAVRALGRTASTDAVPALLALLDAPNRRESEHYITLALLRMGPAAVGRLTSALLTHGPRGRCAAAKVLGWLGEPSAVAPLQHSLDDGDPAVRAAAVEALGRIGLPTPAGAMRELLSSAQPVAVRQAAATALGRLGDPRSADVLTGLLVGETHVLARAAAGSLALLGPKGVTALRGWAHVPEAAEVLIGLGEVDAGDLSAAASGAASTMEVSG